MEQKFESSQSIWHRSWKLLLIIVIVIVIVLLVSIGYIVKTVVENKNSKKPENLTNSAENAENFEIIKNAIEKEGAKPDWLNSNCVFAYTNTETDYQLVSIRENHSVEGCQNGDPNISPTVDNFKLKDGIVEWLDPVSGQYVSLSVYHRYLDSLPQ